MTAQVAIALAVGVAASTDDLMRRRISNLIPAAALASGVAVNSVMSGWHGTLSSVLGALAGFAVFLVFYLLGGMGGGDVKLMAGFGAIIGLGHLLEAALWTAAIGGLLAAAVIAFQTVRGFWKKSSRAGKGNADSIPYAPAIALGVWLSLVPKG